MKTKLLAFLMACPTFFLLAQSKSDTLQFLNHLGEQSFKITEYDDKGQIKKATYTSKLDAYYSKEDLFMRGLKVTDVNNKSNLVDSVLWYSSNGYLIKKKIYSQGQIRTFDYEYNHDWKLQRVVKNDGDRLSKIILFENGLIALNRPKEVIEGRIGDTINYTIPVKFLKKQEVISVRVTNLENYVRPAKEIKWKEGLEGEIELRINFSPTIVQAKIILENSKGELAKLPIEIIGYDLFTQDFKGEDQPVTQLELGNRKKIVIKSEGNNKLVRLYHRKQLIDNYPISQFRSKINVKGFKKGVYLLEAIDLGSNDKKYCRINLN